MNDIDAMRDELRARHERERVARLRAYNQNDVTVRLSGVALKPFQFDLNRGGSGLTRDGKFRLTVQANHKESHE